jgi:hypothetical protein
MMQLSRIQVASRAQIKPLWGISSASLSFLHLCLRGNQFSLELSGLRSVCKDLLLSLLALIVSDRNT